MEPPVIKKLDETVINRIAAGEVIQRPANALKEMLENSLDAKSTTINVTVQQGGLRLLQIQDNGCGIRKDDLPILCERFTTSKLSNFEDLLKITTYGFRGEALCSISHVAHLTVVTKTPDSPIGFKAVYVDGKMTDVAKPCAALQGTQIKVEDLFYNVATRRKAFKNASEEYSRILDVVGKYAIHNSKVSFCLKKGDSTDLRTPLDSNQVDNIRMIYGDSIAKELIEVSGSDETLQFNFSALVTNANFSDKKFTFLLFINHRLVDSSALKKVLEHVYSIYLPKGSHPFVYLSLNLNPANVDVNVHPTKHEVHFLHEETIIDKIRSQIENKLVNLNSSRTMYIQGKLPPNFSLTIESPVEKSISADTTRKQPPPPPKETVRVDHAEQKIDKFLQKEIDIPQEKEKPTRVIKLLSILNLRGEVEKKLHKECLAIVRNFYFVGVVSPKQFLLQYDTKLYLCAAETIFTELFYQMLLFDFANFGLIRFSNTIRIKDLVLLHINSEEYILKEDLSKDKYAEAVESHFVERATMLEDYFSMDITSNGCISSLPLILDQYTPNMGLLPEFLVSAYENVDWNLEQPCLEGMCKELATFYASIPIDTEEEYENIKDSKWKRQIEHVILPAVKTTLLPPCSFAENGTFLEIANLPDLYRVFERC